MTAEAKPIWELPDCPVCGGNSDVQGRDLRERGPEKWRCTRCQLNFGGDTTGSTAPREPRAHRAATLDAARKAVMTDRAATHGELEDSFGQIAAVWSARLGVTVTPAQVCLLLVDLKTCRAWGNPGHDDNWIDIAGYAACGAEVAKG